MSHRGAGRAPSRLVAVLGPTNTGKTHLAIERMLGHASGMIGLPLRLLAREVYDRIVRARGPRAVALITGEEKIVPPRAHYFVCTVEAMPLARQVEFLALDEAQLAADPDRGHTFTDRLLRARGQYETMVMGSASLEPLVRRLLPGVEVVGRERFSTLAWSGPRKLTRLPRRSAVVAFSAEQVYAVAELIRRQRGGAAVVMGSLSPRTRNAQVGLYQSGEVDFLVATDAIGMGLNMDVDHVAFAGLDKFDGRRRRALHPQEVGQIAGRAGRFRRDGTFGITGGCRPMDEELIEAVEAHRYDPMTFAYWRNSDLDLSSLADLTRSLARPPPMEGLKRIDEAQDEQALRRLSADPQVVDRCRDRSALLRLWDACQIPDFRKIAPEDHVALVRLLFDQLSSDRAVVDEAWMAEQTQRLDRLDGEIEALSGRLAGVRTLAYIANRPDWLGDPDHWRERTRELEDRLSDTLHEKLMARFVDRRTSALVRSLGAGEELLAGVAADGAVTVEGHYLGRLEGVRFEPVGVGGGLEGRALRAAAQQAVGPEIARRLGRLAADADEAFAIDEAGDILWRGEAAGTLTGGDPFRPQVRLFGDLGPAAARERAARRLEAFATGQARERLAPLCRLDAAVAEGALKGLARGLAWRLIEAGGAVARRPLEREVAELSRGERRALKTLGVRFGEFAVWLEFDAAGRALAGVLARRLAPDWTPAPGPLTRLPEPAPPPRALGLRGLAPVADLAVPVAELEALSAALRLGRSAQGVRLEEPARQTLGWTPAEARQILRGLGFAPARRPAPGEAQLWRRRRDKPRETPAPAASPFAGLAVLQAPQTTKRRPPRRRPRPAGRARA